MREFNVGDKLMIMVEAEVIRKSDAHGLCYQVKLPKRDYNHDRTIFLDPDEIAEVGSIATKSPAKPKKVIKHGQ